MPAKKRTRKPPARKPYTHEDRAAALAALAANGGNLGKTSAQLSVPRNTLRLWAKDLPPAPRPTPVPTPKKGVSEVAVESAPGAMADLADLLEGIARKITGAMPAKIEAANLQQLSVSLGIAIEKVRLLREQSTGNQAVDVRIAFIEVPARDPAADRGSDPA